ncbi:MAG: hypothetical protein MJZ13_05930 [Bacteroidales bacterium]|nr:hypothetical protein [Bacteroidales bacterium]
MNILVLNSPWISNDFLFAIFSGGLASAVIALLLEIKQYRLNKISAKDQIFKNSALLYDEFSVIKYTLLRIKEQPDNIVSPQAFDIPLSICGQIQTSLQNIHYIPIWGSDKTKEAFIKTNELLTNSISPFFWDVKFIEQAVIYDKLLELKETGKSINPTYNSYYTKRTVDKLICDITPIVDEFTVCMNNLAKSLGRSEKWKQMYSDFAQYEENYNALSLEKYLGG